MAVKYWLGVSSVNVFFCSEVRQGFVVRLQFCFTVFTKKMFVAFGQSCFVFVYRTSFYKIIFRWYLQVILSLLFHSGTFFLIRFDDFILRDFPSMVFASLKPYHQNFVTNKIKDCPVNFLQFQTPVTR